LRRDAIHHLDPEADKRYNGKFRRVRGTLNRLTPEKFDKLSLELLNVGIDSQVVLKGIILLIFEKALDEPKYSRLYAQLCNRLCEDAPNFESNNSTISTFKRLLLNKCQDEFENRSRATEAFDQKDGPLTSDEEEQFLVAKHKMLGNIKFIGELGKLELLHEGILHKCIQTLLVSKRHATADMGEDLECLCQIMRTVGRRLDSDKARAWMDQYFQRMKVLTMNPEHPSRIRFMLQDTIELRNCNWVPRKILTENGPKTIQQVRQQAAKEFGINIPTPPSPGSTMIQSSNMDLFGRPLNNGSNRGPQGRMPPDVMFGSAPVPLSPPFMSGSLGIGTGPGTIHIDIGFHVNSVCTWVNRF
jgi:translation initiation factor 4G